MGPSVFMNLLLTDVPCRFVATEEGILEYPVNIAARKTFPGMAFI